MNGVKLSLPLLALALSGCLSSAPKSPVCWTVEMDRVGATPAKAVSAPLPEVRLTQFSVRSPYGSTRLAVLRADGSVAFDGFNSFADQPSLLLRGVAVDALAATGVFEQVFDGATSSASAGMSVEIAVTRLALDCRAPGRRAARVDLAASLLEGRDFQRRRTVSVSVPVEDGDLSGAFSRCFVQAVTEAAGKLAE